MATICPFCSTEVSESSIEAEDGCCPECGAVISVSNAYTAGEDADLDSEYDDEPDGFDLDDEDDGDFGDFDDEFGLEEFDEDGFEEFDFGDEIDEEEDY